MTLPDPNYAAQERIGDVEVPADVRERAERLGTWGKINRNPQYQGPERARPEALLKTVNVQGDELRALKADKDRMQAEILQLKIVNKLQWTIITASLTSSTVALVKIVIGLHR